MINHREHRGHRDLKEVNRIASLSILATLLLIGTGCEISTSSAVPVMVPTRIVIGSDI